MKIGIHRQLTEGARALPILQAHATGVLCSICPDPGHCCRGFRYSKTFWVDLGLETAQKWLAKTGVPFIIKSWTGNKYQAPEDGRLYSRVYVTCPKLTGQGLCSIYENRPEACRAFQPGSDRLCVFASQNGIKFWEEESNVNGSDDK